MGTLPWPRQRCPGGPHMALSISALILLCSFLCAQHPYIVRALGLIPGSISPVPKQNLVCLEGGARLCPHRLVAVNAPPSQHHCPSKPKRHSQMLHPVEPVVSSRTALRPRPGRALLTAMAAIKVARPLHHRLVEPIAGRSQL